MSSKSLKSEYAKWLWMVLLADLIAVLFFLVPGVPSGASLAELGSWRLLTTIVAPVVVLLLVDVLPNELKCLLVYWRPYGWLPGSEAFSKYGPGDPRVDMQALEQHVGSLPTDTRKQNARWYQLYKQIEDEAEIRDSQQKFLLYRDLAVLSLPFVALAPVCLYLAGASAGAQWIGAGIFIIQYLLTATSARHRGIRFVTNVVAVHSARQVSPNILAAE